MNTARAGLLGHPKIISQDILSSWISDLEWIGRNLNNLTHSTESDFLSIGGSLQGYYNRAGEIVGMANEVVALISGESVVKAMACLHQEIRTMNEFFDQVDVKAEGSSIRFTTILSLLEKVAQPLSGFKKINKSLSMLGISTKIESSRLGLRAAGFNTLANDVSMLSVQVIEKSDSITGQKESLSALIRQTMLSLISAAAGQRQAARALLEKSNESLGRIDEVNSRCASMASIISSVSAEVAQSIGEVVTSLQFHDISRQQIEHVQEALDELLSRLRDAAALDTTELIVDAAHLCELQAAQLLHSKDEILFAVDSIIDNLQAIVSQESHLLDEAGGIIGVADQTDGTFFVRMQSDLSLVTKSLAASAVQNSKLACAMDQVAGTVGDIYQFVSDIKTIGEEIELIALNAQIKAAHTGSEGAALGVLAEAIQRLSGDTGLHTNIVTDNLKDITDFIESLYQGVNEDSSDMEADVGEMVKTFEALFNLLRQINRDLGHLLDRISQEVQSLSRDLDRASGGITVHKSIDRAVSEVIDVLNRIVADAKAVVPEMSPCDTPPLKLVAGRYTMHSERKVHAAITGAQIHSGAGGSIVESDCLGDNVELF